MGLPPSDTTHDPAAKAAHPDRKVGPWRIGLIAVAWVVSFEVSLLHVTPPHGIVPLWLLLSTWAGTFVATVRVARRWDLPRYLVQNVAGLAGIAWALIVFSTVLNYPVVGLPLFELGVYPLLALAGLVAPGVAIATIRRRAQAILGILAVVLTCVVVVVSYESILWGGVAMRTRLLESEYEQDLAALNAEGRAAVEDNPTLIVDSGPPERVLWTWWSGVLDNIGGVLYDPSRTADVERTVLKETPGMVSVCTHLYDDWFYCAFN